ncbi:MAG: triphosphoribosyl-dephospho-CoA synthase [Pigmentiphaga sp.]
MPAAGLTTRPSADLTTRGRPERGQTLPEPQTRLTVKDFPTLAADQIGRHAVIALYEELTLYPKPGLVSRVDSGSHADMNAGTFLRSLFSLRRYFPALVRLGASGAPFTDLQAYGIVAEARMLETTGGVNTHRGAVFLLGLLCASAGASLASGEPLRVSTLPTALLHHWGTALAAHAAVRRDLPGSIAARQYGLRSAAQEAALGFPVLFEHVLPALQAGLRCGLSPALARLDALFTAIVHLDDTNLARRGGTAGLAYARDAAHGFLAAGGAGRDGGLAAALELHREFVSKRLSPGGAADMLAAACWLVRLETAGLATAAAPPSCGADFSFRTIWPRSTVNEWA